MESKKITADFLVTIKNLLKIYSSLIFQAIKFKFTGSVVFSIRKQLVGSRLKK